jgi:cyclic-di-GMP-binding protein
MPSFDVVSKLDWAEVDNALNQAQREVAQRFDFKGTDASLEKVEQAIVVRASTEERARAAVDVLEQKLVRRKVSLKHLDQGEAEPGPKGSARIRIQLKEGIEVDKARQIVKLVKDHKLKVQAAIQEQSVRISGKKRDDLQQTIVLLRAQDLGIEMQFVNFRD